MRYEMTYVFRTIGEKTQIINVSHALFKNGSSSGDTPWVHYPHHKKVDLLVLDIVALDAQCFMNIYNVKIDWAPV